MIILRYLFYNYSKLNIKPLPRPAFSFFPIIIFLIIVNIPKALKKDFCIAKNCIEPYEDHHI
jgi:hypothetical protein